MVTLVSATANLRIGITQRRMPSTETSFAKDALDANWNNWFTTRWPGLSYVPVPNFARADQALAFVGAWGLNGFVFSGGEDQGSSPERDMLEATLLEYAALHRMPILGVCRGMQVLHCRAGGGLTEHPGHAGGHHNVLIGPDLVQVNSWHHRTISQLAPGWRTLATADDGTIEAMQHRDLPWLGLMWHPERAGGDPEPCRRWIGSVFGHFQK